MGHRKTRPPISAVDLFCGVGGLTHGLAMAGVRVTAGIDLDGTCRHPYEDNNAAVFLEGDVRDLAPGALRDLVGEGGPVLLAGCAPCQPFSTYSQAGRAGRDASDGQLLASFGQLVCGLSPDLVAMENVPAVATQPVFEAFLRDLGGYHVSWSRVDCSLLGIPQTRKRLVLLASRLGPDGLTLQASGLPPPTVRETISGLMPLAAGETDPSDPLHSACNLSEMNLKRIRASKPGGTWRDWDPSLRAACHSKSTGENYASVYGRMEWDAPAPTVTTQCFGYGNGRFGHPEQDRAITLREAALLQTFPPGYSFHRPGRRPGFSEVGRWIGNAVPVRLGEAIGRTLVAHAALYGR